VRSGERAMVATWGLVLGAACLLEALIFTDRFDLEYVASYSNRALPAVYKIAALWAGQAGSLLFWLLILCSYGAAILLLNRRRNRPLMPVVTTTMAVTAFFFLLLVNFMARPFVGLTHPPADGQGMNPQLQNPFMAIHPPCLYLGYVGLTVPFAFAIAALATGRLSDSWFRTTRRFTIISWFILGTGILLGGWWAYVELGWGGYWAWDPVENASLLPWLTMTAFLHSVMIQEKRGMLKRWNLGLIIGTFLLSIFGTFITRSGVIASVHSFTQSNVGYFFLAFLAVSGVLAFTLLYTRWPSLRAEVQLESMLSREAAFLFNNLLLVGVAFSVLWGTLFPILSELVRGSKITVGPPFFNRVNIPIGLLLLALTGVGPLIAWRKASTANLRRQFTAPVASGLVTLVGLLASGMRDFYAIMALALAGFVAGTIVQEFWRGVRARRRMHGESVPLAFSRLVARNRRRYGGYLVHVGVLIYFVAFSGMAFKREMEATLKPGQSVRMQSPFGHTYTLTHMGVSQFEALNRIVSAATVAVAKDGKPEGLMTSEKRQHVDSFKRPTFEPSTEVGIRSGLQEDLYITYAGSVNGTEEAVYRFTINPLVWWLWFGGFVLVFGGVVTMWPGGGPTVAAPRRAVAGYEVALVGGGPE
jgi:cytochrome c-type biogenesis protein CcmF